MMDTQETNLPKEEEILTDETGKLKEPQTPEISPEVITIESDEKVEEVITQTETNVEDTAAETDEPVETPVSLEETVEDTAAEVATKTDVSVEDPTAETDGNVDTETPAEIVVKDTVASPDEKESVTDEPKEKPSDQETPPAPKTEEGMIVPLDPSDLTVITKSEIIARLKQLVDDPDKYAHNEADVLKQTYYKLRHIEVETSKNKFLEDGGEEHDFVIPNDKEEAQLKSLISEYREKRAYLTAIEERQKEANYILKQHLIERLKALTESQDDFNKRYSEFREIQHKWKEIKLVPPEHAKELWRKYQKYNEIFYDLVKINNQLRDYDFKKNLALKTALCETVERLDSEPDVVSASHQLQKLHQQWHEIGPVARDFRDSIWERFKAASMVINKKQQARLALLKAYEENNFREKTAICEKIENINSKALKTGKDWEEKTKEVKAIQAEWRVIGSASRKQNLKLFERFRAASNAFFNKKNEFYNTFRQKRDKNFELKQALINKAESMKDRTDWKEATKAFIEIQSEWKKIGPVPLQHIESTWNQFIAACDYFFEQKNKQLFSHKLEEEDNLEAKKALIEKIHTIDENLTEEDALSILRGYISDWGNIGFVPFREKERLYRSFREAVDRQFDRLKVNERDRRVQQFRSNLTELAGAGRNKLYNERDRLMRTYDRMRSELQTCENNIGFFNISSKGGDGLLKEMDRKIDRLKEEMEVIAKKIEAIDENLD
jgi:hypothetical protein